MKTTDSGFEQTYNIPTVKFITIDGEVAIHCVNFKLTIETSDPTINLDEYLVRDQIPIDDWFKSIIDGKIVTDALPFDFEVDLFLKRCFGDFLIVEKVQLSYIATTLFRILKQLNENSNLSIKSLEYESI